MIDCAVIGASGYGGAELVTGLSRHPEVSLTSVQAESSAGTAFDSLYPGQAHVFRGVLQPIDPTRLHGEDVVFLALPAGIASRVAAELIGKVGTIIDLSGDLRCADAAAYRRWYGQEHSAPHLLGQAVYGLPELFGNELLGAKLVACAGCYATVAQLAAAPALGLSSATGVVIHAISGTTGAGRKADVETSFSEVAENMRAYRVGRHQHVPEITAGLERWGGRPVRVTFVPHLAPLRRGIFASAVLPSEGLDPSAALNAYRAAYAESAFVRIVDPAERLPQTRDVCDTNFCDLAPVVDAEAGTLVVLGVLDNLGKGAAGQALQIMNRVLGWPETLGLLPETQKGVGRVHFEPVG